MLKILSESINKKDSSEVDCKTIMGDAWSNLERLARKEVYSEPEKDDLVMLIKDMSSLESYFGEEYFFSTQVLLTVLAAEQSRLDVDQIKNMLD